MIIYNVTVNVEHDIEHEWVNWMKNIHIPEVMQTGMFTSQRFLKLLNEIEGNTGSTYAIQYYCHSMQELQDYLENFAPSLQKKHTSRYEGKFVAFRTFLEEL